MMSDIEASNNSKAHTGLEEEEIEEVEPKDGAQSAKIGISSKGGEETAGDGNRVIDLTDFHQLSYIGVFLSAMVLVIALTIKEDDVTFTESEKWFKVAEYGEYGLAAGAIAMIWSLIGWAIAHFEQSETLDKIMMGINYFLFVWCFIAACFMTFPNNGPFPKVTNGYFGSWGMAIFATYGLGVNMGRLRSAATTGSGATMALIAASIVEIVALGVFVSDAKDEGGVFEDLYKEERIYAMVISCLTVVVMGCITTYETYVDSDGLKPVVKLANHSFFAIAWIVLACLVTFRGPFAEDVSNGYFGAWGGMFASVFAFLAAKSEWSESQ